MAVLEALTPTSPEGAQHPIELSIVMPCLNEAETIEVCIRKAMAWMRDNSIEGEVVIADNGSTDGSQQIAGGLGAIVVPVASKGYGSALQGGIAAARGRFVIMGDADDSYDFSNLKPFLRKLREGCDLVMGNRFLGGIQPGAMPPLHRYLGNPVLTAFGRLFFGSPCGDFHCGLRGFSRQAILDLGLQTSGMEFASEMVVKATLRGLSIAEVPTTLSKDGRSRPPHLRSWRDGWRHLRFLLIFSPRWLFLYPGLALMLVGLLLGAWLLPGPRMISGVTLDVHSLVYASALVVLGFQAVLFSIFAKVFAVRSGVARPDRRLATLGRYVSLELGLSIGAILTVAGLGGLGYVLGVWGARSFGDLNPLETLRVAVPASLALTIGVQVVFSSFFLSVLSIGAGEPQTREA